MEEQETPPEKDAVEHILARKDKSSLSHRFIDHFKGKGLVSRKTIEPSEFVVEYCGKISYHKGRGRRKKYGENNYLYEFSWKGLNWCIDASREYRSLGRFVNDDHVNPNCEMKNIVCGGKPHMCLFAVRQISPGEEITYNYGDFPYPWRSMLQDSGTSDPEESYCDDDDKLPDTGRSQDNDRSANSQLDVGDGSPLTELDSSQEMMESVPLRPDDASCSKQDESAVITDEHSSDEEYLPDDDIQESEEPTFAWKNYCYVCGKGMTKLTRHFLRHADDETEIAGAFALPLYSKERKRLFEDLRNRGNYKHNQEVLRNNSGELKLKRRPSKRNVSAKAFGLCQHCKGLYKRIDLSRHVERCHSRTRSCPVNSTSTIPFTRDVQDFYRYLETTSASAIKTLKMYENPQVYNVLSKLTLAQVTVLNKGAPEVSKMSLKSFQERHHSTRVLSQHCIRINIVSKNRLKVSVLLTPELVSAITLLVDKRQNCGVHKDNPFLFAKPDRTDSSFYSGAYCIRGLSNLCEAKNPEHLRTAHLHKHIAIVFQILNLENNELDHLAKLLGRDIRADRDYFRLPEAAVELAKIVELLVAMEKGSLEKFKGISLDEMEIEDELEPDVEMCKPKDSDTEEDSDESDVPPLQNENGKRPCRKRTPEKDALEHIKTRRDQPFLQEMLIDTIKGKGVFTCQSIEPSSFVVEYRGNISTRTETRGEEQGDTLNNYLFDFSWNGTNWRVDASKTPGGLGRLVNDDHISPNCEMKKIDFEEKPHLCLFAVKKIHRGEEITYDYGDSSYPWRSTRTSEDLNSTQTHLKDAASSPEEEMVKDFEACSSKESCGDDEYVPGPDEEPSSDEYDNDVKEDDEKKNNPYVVELDSSEHQPTDDSPVQQEDDSNDHPPERESLSLSPANKNYCYVCGRPQSKISRHLLTHRHEEADIAQVFALRRNSKERKRQMDNLRKRGNYKHNQEVLKTCRGELKVAKRPKASLTKSNLFASCLYCKGMYCRKEMWRHVRMCSNKLFKSAIGPKTKILSLVATTVKTEPREMTSYVRDVLNDLNNDEISSAVREDCHLLRLAQCMCFTNKTKKQSAYIRQRLREMGRLLLRLRKKEISCFEDAVKPENFSKVVEAVKELSGFREETQSCDRPSLPHKLGETLKKIGDISYAVALKEDADKETIHRAETFMRLCAEVWGPRSKSFINKPSAILFTQDMQLLYQCIEKTAASAVQSLTMYESPPVYNALLRVTLAQVVILNANVFRKVPRITLKSFQERDDAELHTDASVGRSQLEEILCKRFVTINVMSKAERKGHDKEIAVMLTPELLSAITLLVSKREACGVHALNPFLFARPVAIRTSSYQGQTCIRLFVARCGAKNLETQRPAFRKHMVRTYQILSLTNDELDQLAKLLGRDIHTDRDYYQKPEAAGDIAKISVLLSERENGSAERFEGKSFEDIEIPDELQPDLKECDSDNSDANDDCEDAESSDSSPPKRVSSSKKRGRPKRKKSESEESVQDEEEDDEGNAEGDDQSEEEGPGKCAEDATNLSFSDDEDMNVDFDMDEDTDEDVRNDNRDRDVGSDGSAAMPVRTQVTGRREQDKEVSDNKVERSPQKNSTDTDPEETMDVDAEETDKRTGGEGADDREVDTSGSSAALNTEKKKRLLAQMNGMKKVKVLIRKLDINLQNPVHISKLPSVFKKWLKKDQPLQDDDKEPETSTSSTEAKNQPTTEEATHMTCSHCEKIMMKGQTAYQKKGFTHVFCSKSCLFEKFPVNKPDTKTCHSCHKMITQPLDLVMAVVDAQGTMKDFCTLTCLCLFKSKHVRAQTPKSLCSMCNKSCTATCELSLSQAVHKFCHKSCLDGFCRDNMPTCDHCSSHCQKQPLMVELEEDGTKTICSAECLTEFKEKTETPQPCSMCLTSQQMSDMVNYKSIEGTVKLFCNRGCMVSYQLKPAAQENKRKAWLKKKKKSQQTHCKPNTDDVSVVSSVDGAAASQAAEEPTLITRLLINAASCVSCRSCEQMMMKGQTVYHLKSASDVFCSASCFTQLNPHIKVASKHCHNCFQVILQPLKVILAPVGDVGTMKELCSETCLASVTSRMSTAVLKTQPRVDYHQIHNPTAPPCDVCASACTDDQFLLKMEESRVCSKECLVNFKEKVKTPQVCPMCQTSHHLSDMVEDKDQDGRLDFFCSNRCLVVYKAQFLTKSAKTSSSSEEHHIKDVTPKDVKPKTDFIKEELVDEGYNQNLPPGVATEHIKDEPSGTKDLQIDPVFFLTTDSPPSVDTALCHVDLKLSCLSCKKTLMDGETVYQRKDHADVFCSTACILTFYQMRPVRKTCQFCLEEVRESQDVLQFPVEPEGTLKDFCSQACLSSFNYEKIVSTKIPIVPLASHSQCSMCGRYCISKHEIIKQGLVHKICSEPCFFRFCNLNNLSLCQNCHCRCNTLLILKMKEGNKKLCTAACVAQVKKTIRTWQPCVMCQSSCPASDMVETITGENVVELFCTNSCVMAAKIQAASASDAPLNCDSCGRNTLPACHLAMPAATIRNFCTLACAMTFKETQKDTSASSHLSGASDLTNSDFLKPPENLLCAQCRRIIKISPKVVQQKGKMTFVCSLACSQEFKRVTNIMTTCEYCRTEGIAKDAKRIDSKDCFFCSDGCKILLGHELERKWGKHCYSCAYCRSCSRTVLTANYAGKTEEFCSEVCMSKYNMLYCCYAKCDTCSHKGKLRESLSMLGEVKHFCDLRCVLHFCNKMLQVFNTDSSSPESSGAAASSPIITSVISLSSQNKTLSSTTQPASSSPESSRAAESSPVITNVVSLASHLAHRNNTSSSTTQHESVPEIQTKVVGHASVQTAPRELKNKSVLCSPLVHNKGVSCTTVTVDAEAQTDIFLPKVIVLPLPVPAYVPLPMNMYSQFTPQPVGLPVPLPVPIFLPVALDRPAPAMKERVEPPEAELHLRSETGTQQDGDSERENGLRAEELTPVDEKQETQDLNEDTSSFDDDLDTNNLGSFNLQEHSFTDVSLWSLGQQHTPAPPPIREEPASSAPAPPPSQPTLQSKAHNKNEGPKLPRLCKVTKEETFQRDLSKLVSRKPHKQKSQCGIDAWKRWIQGRKSQTNLDPVSYQENVLLCSAAELSDGLCCFVNEVKRDDGEPHPPDSLFYLCLSIQQFLFENDRMENIFSDVIYSKFNTEFNKILQHLKPSVTDAGCIQSCVEEEFLWDCKQLGAYSPIVLLNTLLFFCCKYFGFTTVEQHRQLSFTQLTCCTRTNLDHTRTTSLRFYPPTSTTEAQPDRVPAKKRKKDNVENVLEMMENTENPLHCPVRLYEFYLSKCPETVKQCSDRLFLRPDRCCVPSSPHWFDSTPLDGETMEAMLARTLTVRELQDRRLQTSAQRTTDDTTSTCSCSSC
ncbi:uncharacterized protein LOC133025555 [Limanda limanda]|uniref:uncharacterized protein LOC133025555 n=1 Tax=Limanda limanda TaxID=27771 RepID=UPI0029C67166|nr:uncharacterized protein LOC133025555 [Limanda limanda]